MKNKVMKTNGKKKLAMQKHKKTKNINNNNTYKKNKKKMMKKNKKKKKDTKYEDMNTSMKPNTHNMMMNNMNIRRSRHRRRIR